LRLTTGCSHQLARIQIRIYKDLIKSVEGALEEGIEKFPFVPDFWALSDISICLEWGFISAREKASLIVPSRFCRLPQLCAFSPRGLSVVPQNL